MRCAFPSSRGGHDRRVAAAAALIIAAVADQSYLPDVAGGMVVAASFADDDAARTAVDLLHGSGVRWQDISVIARDHVRAAHIAGDRAWTPWKAEPTGLMARLLA